MSPGAQNIKLGLDASETVENESGSAKQENGIRHPQYRRKRIRTQKKGKRDLTPTVPPKMEPDALVTAENMSETEKQENGKGRPRYRRKRVW
jgi:hypothetical protein